jgi:hypothetical protein
MASAAGDKAYIKAAIAEPPGLEGRQYDALEQDFQEVGASRLTGR